MTLWQMPCLAHAKSSSIARGVQQKWCSERKRRLLGKNGMSCNPSHSNFLTAHTFLWLSNTWRDEYVSIRQGENVLFFRSCPVWWSAHYCHQSSFVCRGWLFYSVNLMMNRPCGIILKCFSRSVLITHAWILFKWVAREKYVGSGVLSVMGGAIDW